MIDLPDGCYFGLPEAEYLALPRLGASGIKTIGVSPLQFWLESPLNPKRVERDETPARKLGKAIHKLLLEGDEAFDATYAVAPTKADHPDAIDGGKALQAECKRLGVKASGTIAEMCERLREADPVLQLWPDIMDEFNGQAEGRIVLTRAQWDEIQQVRYVLNHMPDVKSAFTDGFPEVTILFHDGDVPMKARLDFWKIRRDAAGILDVKSFANIMLKPIETVPEEEIGRNGYFVQPVTYTLAREAARKLWLAQGMDMIHVIDGPEPTKAWLDIALGSDKCRFDFLFVQTGGVPNIVPVEFAEYETFGGQGRQTYEYWRKGFALYRQGIRRFRECMKLYGPDVPWIVNYPPRRLKDEGFRPWALEYTEDFQPDEVAA